MNTIERLFATLCLGATLSAPALASEPARFQGLGRHEHADRYDTSWPAAISADGTTVVGRSSYGRALRWTAETGMVALAKPWVVRGMIEKAYGVSGDGRIVVGEVWDPSLGYLPFLWTPEAGMTIPSDPPFGHIQSWTHVSDDGLVAIATTRYDSGWWASSRWSASKGYEPLPQHAIAVDLSADGAEMAATMWIYASVAPARTHREAAHWTAEEGFVPIGVGPVEVEGPPSRFLQSRAEGISADGSAIVGAVEDWSTLGDWEMTRMEAFLWTEAGGMQLLGDLPGGLFVSSALDVSAGGDVIVGSSLVDDGSDEAVIWDPRHGMRKLKDALEDEFGLGPELSGWRLREAIAISDDGRAITGGGTNPIGRKEAFLITLPRALGVANVAIDIRPGITPNEFRLFDHSLVSVALLGSDALDARDVDIATLGFGPAHAPPALASTRLDVNRDGHRDLVAAFRVADSGIALGDVEACLDGRDVDGLRFEGCDAVSTLSGCGRGFGAALLVPPLAWLWRRRP